MMELICAVGLTLGPLYASSITTVSVSSSMTPLLDLSTKVLRWHYSMPPTPCAVVASRETATGFWCEIPI